MSLNEIFTKGYNDNKSRVFRIKTVWEDDCFQLFVIESTNSWFTLVSKELIEELAEQHELNPEVYLKNLKQYFSSGHDSSITFDILKKQFVMYRNVTTESLRVKYFLTNLEKLSYQETIETIIDELITKQQEMLERLEIAEEQKSESAKQKILYQQKCEEFVEMKRKADHKMYSAFTLILNEKKHHIQFLTELLEKYKNEGNFKFNALSSSSVGFPNDNKTIHNKNKIEKIEVDTTDSVPSTSKVCRKKILECVSDSESNDGYDTDEEKELKIHLDDQNTVVSTTSREDLDFLGDSSPPPSLPKRTKKNKDVSTLGSLLDSPKKETEAIKKTIEINTEPMDTQEDNLDNGSQSPTFNTQELQERMW